MQNFQAFNVSAIALIGSTALGTATALGLSGCGPDFFSCSADNCGGSDGGVDGGGEGGEGGGVYLAPTPTKPSDGLAVPIPYSFLSWTNAPAPAGKTIVGHRVCWTKDDVSTLSSCPNNAKPSVNYQAIPISEGLTYFWD